jgi:hypothetical protein
VMKGIRFAALCLAQALLLTAFSAASAATARLADGGDGYFALPNSQVTASASSELKDRFGKYPAEYANDADTHTTWAERADGNGEGEWITFSFPEQRIIGLTIRAGYHKSKDVYRKNARPREILVSTEGEDEMSVELDDVLEPQTVLFDEPVSTGFLTITLSTFYSGTKYADTCITDVRVLSAGDSEAPADDSWQGRYRSFIRQHFPEYQSVYGNWPFMKLIDLDFDGVPELLAAVSTSHTGIYHIVSSSDIDHWAEMDYNDEFQKGDVFQLCRDNQTGEQFWLVSNLYIIQGTRSTDKERLTYAPGNAALEGLFSTFEIFDPSYDGYGTKRFTAGGDEVTEAEYQRRYQAFQNELETVDIKVARCDEASGSVQEALAHFDEMAKAYG